MERYALRWRQLNQEKAKQTILGQSKKEFLIFLIIISLITSFFLGLQIGTIKGIELGREGVLKELSELLRKSPSTKDKGFMPLPSPKSGEMEEEKKIKI